MESSRDRDARHRTLVRRWRLHAAWMSGYRAAAPVQIAAALSKIDRHAFGGTATVSKLPSWIFPTRRNRIPSPLASTVQTSSRG